MAEHSEEVVVLVAETASRVASRVVATDKEGTADVAVASKRVTFVVALAEEADSEAVDLDVVAHVARVVARSLAITMLSTRTCFSTGTRPVSRTSVRRLRCSRRRSSTVSSKSTTPRWQLEVLLLINKLLETKLRAYL